MDESEGTGEYRDVVVVGTGFGGAVAACRLAQGGQQVLVLERGHRYGRGHRPFPRSRREPWFWAREQNHGPFDVRPLGEVLTVQAAGYGGGSLLYSNVHLRMPTDGFSGWPCGWTRDELDPYYDLVEYMLDVTPLRESHPLPEPERTVRMRDAANHLGRQEQFFLPPLAVSFGEPNLALLNRHDVEQRPCTHCSECNIGCNVGAKNSLDMNYLAVAEDAGADMQTECEVTALSRTEEGYFLVDYTRRKENGVRCRVRARTVVLAAGALNTTELLLRWGHDLGLEPDQVGRHYSANGDFTSFGLDIERPFVPTSGPAITAGILYSEGPDPGKPWFLVEDGGFPPQFVDVVLAALRTVDRVEGWIDRVLALARGGPRRVRRTLRRLFERYGVFEEDGTRLALSSGAADHVAVLLAMGRDSSDGTLRLPRRRPGHPRIKWDVAANAELYGTEQALCDDIVRKSMRGEPVHTPGWRNIRVPVSVHNLGGAVMADDPTHGVVDSARRGVRLPRPVRPRRRGDPASDRSEPVEHDRRRRRAQRRAARAHPAARPGLAGSGTESGPTPP